MKLILGSSSKFRKNILEREGYVFSIISPELDEKAVETPDPYKRPLILAHAKADEIVSKVNEPAIIITSDVVVVGGGKLYEKPEDEKQVREFLATWSTGLPSEVVCAIVVVNTETGKRVEGVDIGKVVFKEFPQEVIEEYIKHGEPLLRAGGYAIQHPIMAPYVYRIEGSPNTIVGVSTELLEKLLIEAGYKRD